MFSAYDYSVLHSIVFQDGYPGYKPDVVESPNGDGKLDTLKRYAHLTEKYLKDSSWTQSTERKILQDYLDKAHSKAIEVAITIGVPREFWPVRKYGALRVLDYGPDAITNEHTDFDLFTLMMYRNLPEYFQYVDADWKGACGEYDSVGINREANSQFLLWQESRKFLKRAQELNKQVHFGEILEEISPIYQASKHEVVASKGPHQYSCVYFAIPDHDSVLPSGVTVGKWLEERMSRSRYDRSVDEKV